MWYYQYPPTQEVKCLPFYLRSIGLHELQPPIAKPEGDPYDQFFYHTHGHGTLSFKNKKYELPPKSGFFLPAGIPHEYYPSEDVWDIRWMVPCGDGLKSLFCVLGIEKGGVYPLAHIQPLDRILNRMHDELIQDPIHGNLYASACVTEFIIEFARQAGVVSETDRSYQPPVHISQTHMRRISEYIQYHYMHPITLDELCRLVSVTPQHLCRIVKQCTGMRPTEYITSVRIRSAKNLLANTTHAISEIAFWCGFENPNYFWKTFRKTENMTPKEYRAAHTREAR